ncbi:MAG: tetratricopeptide repeat protein, partial [Planctomycetaceae bacterium]|nr:tetratricopeptide repeat protein [Planctomycetaceae bacterium]
MSVAENGEFRQLLVDDAPLSADGLVTMTDALSSSHVGDLRQELTALQKQLDAGEGSKARLERVGVCSYLFGQHSRAVRYLSEVSGSGVASFIHGLALHAVGKYSEATEQFDQAAANGYDSVECALRKAGSIRAAGEVDEAEQLLRSVAKQAVSRAEYSYQMGCIWADRGDTMTAIEYFERAVDMDPHHSRALFHLAVQNASHGNDDDAIRLYEQSLSRPPHYLGALLNLGILYEDNENYRAAEYCFRRIMEFDPLNERAQLYLKDIEATGGMYYDEDTARHEARMEQLLSRPVADFELSVRSRNCLQSMGLETLGDLTRINEQELLAGKNFGETSLHEIREIMQAHNLRIGQNLHHTAATEHFTPSQDLSPEEQETLNRPISDLNLSVRARKCMTRLG